MAWWAAAGKTIACALLCLTIVAASGSGAFALGSEHPAVVTAEVEPAPTPTEPTVDDICAAAQALSDLGRHAEALALIDSTRQKALDAIAAGESLSTERVDACEEERAAIVEAAPTPGPTSTPAPTASPTPAPTPVPDAERIGTTWDEFIASSVTPLIPVGSFVLAGALGLFVIARIAARFWPLRTSSGKVRRWTAGIAGTALVLLAPIVFAWLVVRTTDRAATVAAVPAPAPALATPTPVPSATPVFADWSLKGVVHANGTPFWAGVLFVVLGALGVFALSYLFATRQRISIVFKQGTAEEKSLVPELTAIMGDMTGGKARGAEIPQGPDIPALATSVQDLAPLKPFAGWIQSFWSVISSITPWHLEVLVEGDGKTEDKAAAFTLTRNGRTVVSGRATADEPGIDFDEDGPTPWQRVATSLAATAVAHLANAYPSDWGLAMHGATEARGITLQYLAVRWHRTDERKQTGKLLLAGALNADPGNRAALVAFWNYLYRDSADLSDMSDYNRWLVEQIWDEMEIATDGRPLTLKRIASDDLLVRLLLTQGAIARNMSALGVAPDSADLRRANLLLDLLDSRWRRDPLGERARKKLLAEINLVQLSADCAVTLRPTGGSS